MIVAAGFNDAKGINSNPTPDSPYHLGKFNVPGGKGEPGWADAWPASETIISQTEFVKLKILAIHEARFAIVG